MAYPLYGIPLYLTDEELESGSYYHSCEHKARVVQLRIDLKTIKAEDNAVERIRREKHSETVGKFCIAEKKIAYTESDFWKLRGFWCNLKNRLSSCQVKTIDFPDARTDRTYGLARFEMLQHTCRNCIDMLDNQFMYTCKEVKAEDKSKAKVTINASDE